MEQLPFGFFVDQKPKSIELPDPGDLLPKLPLQQKVGTRLTFENVSESFVSEALDILREVQKSITTPSQLEQTTTSSPFHQGVVTTAASTTTSTTTTFPSSFPSTTTLSTTSPTFLTSTTARPKQPALLDAIMKASDMVFSKIEGSGNEPEALPNPQASPGLGSRLPDVSALVSSSSAVNILLATGVTILFLVVLDKFLTQVYRVACRNTIFSVLTGNTFINVFILKWWTQMTWWWPYVGLLANFQMPNLSAKLNLKRFYIFIQRIHHASPSSLAEAGVAAFALLAASVPFLNLHQNRGK